jgi:uncharacterized damage-inducible protein DinB
MESLMYPIGKFQFDGAVSSGQREAWIGDIEQAPRQLREAVAGLTGEQWSTPYRPGGWTVKQVVHHLADSHMNSIVRFKLALTEVSPVIKPYEEAQWALLPDSADTEAEVSLVLLESLHKRWVVLLRSMKEEDYARTFRHPESGVVRLDRNLGIYAWHGRHHIAHITGLRERMGW